MRRHDTAATLASTHLRASVSGRNVTTDTKFDSHRIVPTA